MADIGALTRDEIMRLTGRELDMVVVIHVFRLSHGASLQWWASFGSPVCQGCTAPEAVARAALCDVMGV